MNFIFILYKLIIYINTQMFCSCQEADNQNIREKLQRKDKDTPLKMRIINALGIKKYLIDYFVFRKTKPNYRIQQISSKKEIVIIGKQYISPSGYHHTVQVIQGRFHKIPLVSLRLAQLSLIKPVLIYSHGNSADMSNSLEFINKICLLYSINYVVYDYTGYGISHQNQVSQKSICEDLQKVVEWVNRPLNQIILWGFSLGCHPTIYVASKLKVNSIILQSPFASILSFFQQQICSQTLFKGDCFNNLALIQFIKSNILLIHSKHDNLIPISHSQALYQRYCQKSIINKMEFIQVQNLCHNSMHCYFYSKNKMNKLQVELVQFLKKAQKQMKNKQIITEKEQFKQEIAQEQEQILVQESIKIENLSDKKSFFQKKLRYFENKHMQLLKQQEMQTISQIIKR